MKKEIFRRFLKGGISLVTGAISQNVNSKDGGVGKIDKIGVAGILTGIALIGTFILVATGKLEVSALISIIEAVF